MWGAPAYSILHVCCSILGAMSPLFLCSVTDTWQILLLPALSKSMCLSVTCAIAWSQKLSLSADCASFLIWRSNCFNMLSSRFFRLLTLSLLLLASISVGVTSVSLLSSRFAECSALHVLGVLDSGAVDRSLFLTLSTFLPCRMSFHSPESIVHFTNRICTLLSFIFLVLVRLPQICSHMTWNFGLVSSCFLAVSCAALCCRICWYRSFACYHCLFVASYVVRYRVMTLCLLITALVPWLVFRFFAVSVWGLLYIIR